MERMNIEAKLNSITTDMFIEKSGGLKDILVRLFASVSLDIKSSQTNLKINSVHKLQIHSSSQVADVSLQYINSLNLRCSPLTTFVNHVRMRMLLVEIQAARIQIVRLFSLR
jgi:hypothetical protein